MQMIQTYIGLLPGLMALKKIYFVPLMANKINVACATGMTGPVVIDYKGDRIMDYQVWYLASDSNKFNKYMKIPLTKAGRNATACVEWLVNIITYCITFCTCLCGLPLACCCANQLHVSFVQRGQ